MNGLGVRQRYGYEAICDRCDKSGPPANTATSALKMARAAGWRIQRRRICDDGTILRHVLCVTCLGRLINAEIETEGK